MWGRTVEIMTAVWLALSPFLFRVQDDATIVTADSLIALTIACLSGLSYWRPLRHAHLLILVAAIGLVVWGRLAGTPPPPIHQNHICVGLFLMMIAVIPNHASLPPRAWQQAADSGKEIACD